MKMTKTKSKKCSPVETKRAARRDVFGEVSTGIAALAEARQGKRALRTHVLICDPADSDPADFGVHQRRARGI